jgi:acetoacetate decarboxylase
MGKGGEQMSIPLDKITSMPAFSPYYPMPPTRYRNVRFQHVYFKADVSAVDRVLPSCFEPSEDGFCVATGLSAAWSANYGEFQESLLTVKCAYQGEVGYFSPVVFLNSRSSIPAGREIYGTPKVFADMKVALDERVMYTDTRVAGSMMFGIRSTMEREAAVEEFPKLEPSWRLKVIPRADGNGADVMQIVDGARVTTDVVVHIRRRGEGVVQFGPSPIYDLSGFTPLEYYGAQYVEMDYTEGYAEVVHDFLRDASDEGIRNG